MHTHTTNTHTHTHTHNNNFVFGASTVVLLFSVFGHTPASFLQTEEGEYYRDFFQVVCQDFLFSGAQPYGALPAAAHVCMACTSLTAIRAVVVSSERRVCCFSPFCLTVWLTLLPPLGLPCSPLSLPCSPLLSPCSLLALSFLCRRIALVVAAGDNQQRRAALLGKNWRSKVCCVLQLLLISGPLLLSRACCTHPLKQPTTHSPFPPKAILPRPPFPLPQQSPQQKQNNASTLCTLQQPPPRVRAREGDAQSPRKCS